MIFRTDQKRYQVEHIVSTVTGPVLDNVVLHESAKDNDSTPNEVAKVRRTLVEKLLIGIEHLPVYSTSLFLKLRRCLPAICLR